MPISAEIIEDSISFEGKRITTFQLLYPRFIHAELMTHRVFSRNASSSRAIPVKKMLEMVRTEPAMPIHWGKNQPGMQANEQLSPEDRYKAEVLWREAAQKASSVAERMVELGLHKQVANRILEPFQHISVVLTATELDNWFELRAHKDAQPEIHELALQMRAALLGSNPKLLDLDEWHLPYVTQDERNDGYFKDKPELLRKISAARCCRVSYLKHDGTAASVQDDLDLCNKLAGSVPIHASPFEHQATPDQKVESVVTERSGDTDLIIDWQKPHLHGNLVGWIQYRKLIERSFKS
jgi:thymidylate synthase ThyX